MTTKIYLLKTRIIQVHEHSYFECDLDMIPMTSVSDLQPGDRLYYELNHMGIKQGVFKEIADVERFVSTDKRLHDPEYIKWHNFKIVRQ